MENKPKLRQFLNKVNIPYKIVGNEIDFEVPITEDYYTERILVTVDNLNNY